MSKLTRTLALVAMLAAMNLAGLTAVAQAQAADQHASRPPTDRQVETAWREPQVATQQQTAADAAHRRLLAQERAYSSWGYSDPAIQQALAQERYYSTSGYGDTSAPAPAETGRQAGWLVPALGVLAVVLALVAGVAVLAARRTTRTRRASQTA
jgi:hypothetical protein